MGEIGPGILALVGVTHDDTEAQARKLADKIWNLRIFDDDGGTMNLSVGETTGEVLVVSQFTLYGDTRRGRRPGYSAAARPEQAEPLVDLVVAELRALGATVATGRFPRRDGGGTRQRRARHPLDRGLRPSDRLLIRRTGGQMSRLGSDLSTRTDRGFTFACRAG